MQTKKLIFRLLFLLNIAFAISCARDEHEKKAPPPIEDVVGEDLSEYGQASCKYKYDTGGIAQDVDSSLVNSTFFKKRLDFGLLTPVLAASGAETVRFAETKDVRFYKTTFRNKKNCEFVQTLPKAPNDLSAEFAKTNTDNSTLGLYLDVGAKNLPSVAKHAAILVRNDANKWILVHEYMHHLYQLQRNADFGMRTEDLKSRVIRLTEEFDQANEALKSYSGNYAAKLKTAASKLFEADKILLEFLQEYLLEEMAIENVMAQKLENNELMYVVDQRLNGAAYTISSAHKAEVNFLSPMLSELKNFMSMYQSDLTNENKYDLTQMKLEIQNITAETIALKKKADAFLLSLGLEYKPFRMTHMKSVTPHMNSIDESKEPVVLECTHQQDVAEIIEIFNQRIKNQVKSDG